MPLAIVTLSFVGTTSFFLLSASARVAVDPAVKVDAADGKGELAVEAFVVVSADLAAAAIRARNGRAGVGSSILEPGRVGHLNYVTEDRAGHWRAVLRIT
jgi:hypothetical protein